jgi:hypothetical protein
MKPEGPWKAPVKPRIGLSNCLTISITLLAVTGFWVAFFVALILLTNNWR